MASMVAWIGFVITAIIVAILITATIFTFIHRQDITDFLFGLEIITDEIDSLSLRGNTIYIFKQAGDTITLTNDTGKAGDIVQLKNDTNHNIQLRSSTLSIDPGGGPAPVVLTTDSGPGSKSIQNFVFLSDNIIMRLNHST